MRKVFEPITMLTTQHNTTQHNTTKKNYRKDIQGLRAIAVIAVGLFHFNSAWLPGGFAGVDVFFVISGFLMTGIIFRGLEENNFSILKFYVSRANRIIPPLAILCIVLLIFGWFYLTPLDYKALGKHVGSSVGFISNVIYWRESGYFDAASHEKWLLHTWSLSVEWQFYIIYPLVLVGMKRFFSIKVIKATILLGAISGFVFCIIATYKWPNPAYYLLPSRAWEMMVGGVAYLYPINCKLKNKKALEFFGLMLIIGSYFFVSEESVWPGFLALLPVFGSFCIIQAQCDNSIITGNTLFQKIGTWSYSIYLWHWPLVVAIYYFSLNEVFIYIGLVLSILFGFISYTYIEQIKFRNDFIKLNYLKCKPVHYVLILALLSSFIYVKEGADFPIRLGANTPQAKFLNFYEEAHRNLKGDYWLKCDAYASLDDKGTLEIADECINKKGNGGVFLWGDSHAEALSLGIRELLEPLYVPYYQTTSAGCRASLEETVTQKGAFKKACDYSNKVALSSIEELKPQLVIIAQANDHDKTNWHKLYARIASYGVESVLLVGPVPQWRPSLPKVMIKPSHWNSSDLFISDVGLDLNIIKLDIKMQNKKLPNGLKYKSLITSLCKIDNKGEYLCRVKGNTDSLLQVDYGHLSHDGSLFIINTILSENILSLLNKRKK